VGPLHVAGHALAAYLVLLGLLRLSGKRTVAQGTAFEVVLALLIGDMVDDLVWAEVHPAVFVVGVATLLLTHRGLAFAQQRSARLHDWVCGAPAVVLAEGRMQPEALRRERMHERDLEGLLRLQGMPRERWPDVRVARIEEGGELSVLEVDAAQELERRDLAAALAERPNVVS
jgi:uncharacterized membrane protein YcaP (DUF421 family)